MDAAASTCLVCEKHRAGDAAQGGVLYQDDLVYAGHVHALNGPTVYRGWLVVETKRHVAGLGELTDDEAGAIGLLTNRVARALRDAEGAEHVYSFVYGDAVPHLHVHVAPRYPGTPREYWGPRLNQWPDGPHIGPDAIHECVDRLRNQLGA